MYMMLRFQEITTLGCRTSNANWRPPAIATPNTPHVPVRRSEGFAFAPPVTDSNANPSVVIERLGFAVRDVRESQSNITTGASSSSGSRPSRNDTAHVLPHA